MMSIRSQLAVSVVLLLGYNVSALNHSNEREADARSSSRRLSTVGPWYPSDAPEYMWESISSSDSGQIMFAASSSPLTKVYKTTNYGANWVDTNAPSFSYASITTDSIGQNVAVVAENGPIQISSDGGATWQASFAPELAWEEICSNDSGQFLVAVNTEYENGIYYSTNYGLNWTAANTDAEEYVDWRTVTSDSTGQYVVAAASDYGGIFVSSDFGRTWNETAAPSNYWSSVTSDKSGVYLAASINGGQIYTSNNSGVDWYKTNTLSNSWYGVASDSSGQYLVAVASYPNGGIFNSMDYGVSWYASSTSNYYFYCVASDSSGRYLAAGTEVFNGIVVTDSTGNTFTPTTAPTLPPTQYPTSQPSTQPSSRPSSFPTYVHNTYENTIQILALQPAVRYEITNLGYGRSTYVTVNILMSYLSQASGGYITVTAGSGIDSVVVGTHCAPVVACDTHSHAYCSVNIDVTSVMSSTNGGSVVLTSITNTQQISGATPELCNSNGVTNIYYTLNYTVSAYLQPTFRPTSVPTIAPTSGTQSYVQNKSSVLITSDGAPFYVIGCAMALFAALGVVIVRLHDDHKKLTPLRLLAVCFDMSIQGNIIVSEIFYIVVLMQSSSELFEALAIILIFARLQNAVCGGYLLYKLYTPQYKLYECLDNEVMLLHTKLHSLVQIMMMFDCAMFRFLPWYKSEVTFVSMGFPDPQSFKMCMVTRILQSGIALVVQALVLAHLNKSDINDLYTLALLTLILTMTIIVFVSICLTVCMHLRAQSVDGSSVDHTNNANTNTINAIHDVELQSISNVHNTSVWEERVALLESEVSELKTLHSTSIQQQQTMQESNESRISALVAEMQLLKEQLAQQQA